MHDPTTELMRTLSEAAETHDDFASSLLATTGPDDKEPFAAAFVAQARLHRVEAIKLRAHLAALVDAYGALHLDQPQD